jgi:ABC-type dipeptide/oligopeptide/nickel transport system ATPase component
LPTDRSFLNKLPGEISTGQAQRILIAIALLHRPQLLLADEPTSALDTVTQAGLLNLLRQINQQEGTGILFVSHDLLAAASLCHRLAILSEGHIVETIATSRLAEDAKHPATLALLNALPSIPDGLLDMQRRVSAARSSPAN